MEGAPPVANQIDLFMHFLGASRDGLVARLVEMDKLSSSESILNLPLGSWVALVTWLMLWGKLKVFGLASCHSPFSHIACSTTLGHNLLQHVKMSFGTVGNVLVLTKRSWHIGCPSY